jgi:thioredoxin 1
MKPIEITEKNFEQEVAKEGIVALDFWAEWCGPCKAFAPVFEQAATRYPEITWGKVNTDEQQQLAAGFGVRSIPTLMVFRDGILVHLQPGSMPAAALDEVVAKIKALDMDAVRKEIEEEEAEACSCNASTSSGCCC